MQKEVEDLAQTVINGFGVAGIAIGFVKGEEVFAKGFGVKDIETQEPVTASSLFHLASISKTFVATAVMQLVEQGKLELEAPLVTYLPDFILADERYQQITVQQMLSHTSGMPDTDDYGWDRPEYDDGALERYMHSLANEKLLSDSGEKFAYSNIAFEVLGLLIARTSGQSFEEYVKQHILQPLDMHSSTFLKTEVPSEHGTTPHILLPLTVVSQEYPYNRAHAPSSTLHSSTAELCNWALMNLKRGEFRGQHILQAKSFDKLWHPYQKTEPDYPTEFVGLSWFIDTYRGHRTIHHNGADVGFQTSMILLPDQSLAVIALANTLPAPVSKVKFAIVDLLLGLEPEFPKPPVLVSLATILANHGIQTTVEEFRHLQETKADEYDFGSEQFIDIVYTLREVRRYVEAIQVAQLGLELFPDSSELAELLDQIRSKSGQAR